LVGNCTTINGQIACTAGIQGQVRKSEKVERWSDYSGSHLTGCLEVPEIAI